MMHQNLLAARSSIYSTVVEMLCSGYNQHEATGKICGPHESPCRTNTTFSSRKSSHVPRQLRQHSASCREHERLCAHGRVTTASLLIWHRSQRWRRRSSRLCSRQRSPTTRQRSSRRTRSETSRRTERAGERAANRTRTSSAQSDESRCVCQYRRAAQALTQSCD